MIATWQKHIRAWEWRAPLPDGMRRSRENRWRTLNCWPSAWLASCPLEAVCSRSRQAPDILRSRSQSWAITGLPASTSARRLWRVARANALSAKVQAQFERGDASRMPFDGERFDYVVCRAAFKNFAEPVAALQEMHRVLKPGGRALIIDMRGNASPESMKEAAKGLKNGAVNSWIVYLSFRFMLVRRAYTRAEFERMIGRTAFRQLEIRESLIGLEILLAKT